MLIDDFVSKCIREKRKTLNNYRKQLLCFNRIPLFFLFSFIALVLIELFIQNCQTIPDTNSLKPIICLVLIILSFISLILCFYTDHISDIRTHESTTYTKDVKKINHDLNIDPTIKVLKIDYPELNSKAGITWLSNQIRCRINFMLPIKTVSVLQVFVVSFLIPNLITLGVDMSKENFDILKYLDSHLPFIVIVYYIALFIHLLVGIPVMMYNRKVKKLMAVYADLDYIRLHLNNTPNTRI